MQCGHVEYDYHFVSICPLYAPQRNIFMENLNSSSQLITLSNLITLKEMSVLLNSSSYGILKKITVKYIKTCLELSINCLSIFSRSLICIGNCSEGISFLLLVFNWEIRNKIKDLIFKNIICHCHTTFVFSMSVVLLNIVHVCLMFIHY